jgi:hypothetical protein
MTYIIPILYKIYIKLHIYKIITVHLITQWIPQAQIALYCKTETVFNGLMMATSR